MARSRRSSISDRRIGWPSTRANTGSSAAVVARACPRARSARVSVPATAARRDTRRSDAAPQERRRRLAAPRTDASARLRSIMPDWFLSTDPGYARVAPAPGGACTPVAAFSTRRGGTSAAPWDSLNLSEGVGDRVADVRSNRSRLLGALGLDPARVAWATQVHGAHVLVARGPGLAGTGDALLSSTPDLVLAVGAADCLPVLAWDVSGRAVAARTPAGAASSPA